MSERARLADAQAALVRGLLLGEAPEGFDAARFRVAARSLVNKRVRETARAWPMLARCLGDRYAACFRAFARGNPPPGEGGPLADGWAFLQTLPGQELDDEARRESLLVDLHWRRTPAGLCPRHGFALKRTRIAAQILIGVRIPGLGVRLLSVPWGKKGTGTD